MRVADPNPTTWGPAFWESQYGYVSFEEFYEDAQRYLEGSGTAFFIPPTEATARLAWYSPGSGIGTYLAGRLLLGRERGELVKLGSAPIVNSGRDLAEINALRTETENTMATLIIPNAFQVSIEMETFAQPVVNVVGVTSASGTAQGAAEAVKAAWEGAGKPLSQLSSQVVVRNYRAVDLSTVFGDIADVASTATGGLTPTGGYATLASTALIGWNGASRSRSTRGRLYLGPLLDTQINVDGRTLASATVSAMQNVFGTFRSNLASAGYPLAILSRKNLQAYPVSSHTVSTIIATQRRRLR